MPLQIKAFPAIGTAFLLIAAAANWRERPQRDRAPSPSDPRRGRSATSPAHIPWLGWTDIFIRTYDQISKDRLLLVAAGVVFYGILALFPTISASISLYGLFADVDTVSRHLDLLAGIAPGDTTELLRGQIERIASTADRNLSITFALSLAVALWSANAGTKALFDALNVAYDENEKRGFFKLNFISLLFTLGSIIFLLLAIAAVVLTPIILSTVGLGEEVQTLITWLRWPILFIIVATWISVVYRFGPSRNRPKWKWVSVGCVAATVLWLIGSGLFSFYLSRFADFNATYGSLGAAIGLMIWLWLSVICVLLGAELNAETEHQTARDSTVNPARPRGQRGAVAADRLGEARAEAA